MSKKTNEQSEVELSEEKCPLCGRFLLKRTSKEERPQLMCDICELESLIDYPNVKGKNKQNLMKTLRIWDKEYQKALKRKKSKQKSNSGQ